MIHTVLLVVLKFVDM
ncbi:hypothetical protein CK1_34400 [Ruminococcus sp. SR1/5]|nr:hypothetical protein CK1_34400 [Ruminococcus sp. SR1/5]